MLESVQCHKLYLNQIEFARLERNDWFPTPEQLDDITYMFRGKPFTKQTLEDIFGILRDNRRKSVNKQLGAHRSNLNIHSTQLRGNMSLFVLGQESRMFPYHERMV